MDGDFAVFMAALVIAAAIAGVHNIHKNGIERDLIVECAKRCAPAGYEFSNDDEKSSTRCLCLKGDK